MAQPNSKQPSSENLSVGASHVRSLSQPSFFSNNCLPPLSPFPHIESSVALSKSSLKDLSMEEVDVKSQGPPFVSYFTRENTFRCNDSLPPRKGHRRSNSDVILGFSALIQSSPQLMPIGGKGVLRGGVHLGDCLGRDKTFDMHERPLSLSSNIKNDAEGMCGRKSGGEVMDGMLPSYMNLENVEALNSSFAEDKDKDSTVSGTKLRSGQSSNSEPESVSKGNSSIRATGSREGIKRSADADITPTTRHFRSLSMDSAIVNFHYGDHELPKLPTSLVNSPGQLSPRNLGNERSSELNFDFGDGEFNEAELRKIMADERLAEIAVSDPKRVKRILANRQSASRSKERKLRYISELEHKVQTLQTEATALSTQLTIMQKEFTEIACLNNELKFRLQAMEQQAQLRDALHDTLTAEVQRLKLARGELREEGRFPNNVGQQLLMKPNIFQMHRQEPSEIQQLSAGKPTTTTTASPTPASA